MRTYLLFNHVRLCVSGILPL